MSRTKERALDPPLGACATRPGHAVNMLTEERLCKRHPGAASMFHAAPRHCAPLPAALPEPQSSQISRNACAQPAAQSPGDAPRHLRHVCVLVCMGLGASWAHIRIQDPVPQPTYINYKYAKKKKREEGVRLEKEVEERTIHWCTQDMSSPCGLCRCGRLFTLYEPDSQPARHAQQTAVYHLKYFKSTPPA